ncbi:MAG: tail fiber domain-containing protein [Candidatus Pacebacteria bacterium]|nr:tail fiber domain-containing protein [Candidatus Paceibacterota bacterium]
MSHTLHYKVSIVGALISSIAFTALAVFAIAPGETLDPVNTHNNVCSGPTDSGCAINPYEYLDPEGVLYLDGNGDITTDQSFTRTGDSFHISGALSNNLEVAFLMQEDMGVILGSYPGVGMSYEQDDTIAFMGIIDATGNPQISSQGVVTFSSQDTNNVSAFVLGTEGIIMVTGDNAYDFGSRMQAFSDEIFLDFSYENVDDPMNPFEDDRRITLDDDGVRFSFANNTESYIFPVVDGSVNQILQTDGSGQLSWVTVGGSSPISIGTSGDTLYSDALNAGQGDTATGYNIFLGEFAGRTADNVSHSNFLGANSGEGATLASNSNFFGESAGQGAVNANNANFLGYFAGQGASKANNSNFFGESAGQGAVNAASSIFIGSQAGSNDTVNNTISGTSILIGDNTSTDGNSNSIALGAGATNTAANQFMIGSVSSPIDEMIIVGNGASCAIDNNIYGDGSTGLNCSSDENLKTNIIGLSSVLNTLRNIEAVTYNWKANPNNNQQIGFIAQNLEQYFPEIVREGHDGYLQVNYANMTPILTKAIQELDLKVSLLESQTIASGGFSLASLTTLTKDFLADVGNGIQNIFAKKITTEELCVEDICVTRDQFLQMIENNIATSSRQQDENDNADDEENPEESLDEEVEDDTKENSDEEIIFEEETSDEIEITIDENEIIQDEEPEESLDQETDDIQDDNREETLE